MIRAFTTPLVWLMATAGCCSLLWAQGGPAPVAFTRVVSREVAASQSYVGTVMPSRQSVIGSAVDGRVVEFLAEAGQRVKKGDVLARLRTTTIELELASAKAELKLREAELAELVNGSRPEEIDQARARFKAAEAAFRYAQANRKRLQSLFESGRSVTEDELEQAISAADRSQAALEEARAALVLVEKGPREERIAQAQARVEIQKAEVARLEDRLDKHTVVAPFDGYVVEEQTEVGAWLSTGAAVATVAALQPVEVRVFVLEKHVGHLRPGMEVSVEVPAVADGLFTGTVFQIVPVGDARSRTFPVTLRLNNPLRNQRPVLHGGMLAHVALPTGERRKSLLVPKDALVLGGPNPMVYVVDSTTGQPLNRGAKGRVRPVVVTLGTAVGPLIEVRGILKAGDAVVVRGNERLRPGLEVVLDKQLEPEAAPAASAIGKP